MKRWIVIGVVVLALGLAWLRPRWLMNLVKRVEPSPQVGAELVLKYECRDCHVIEGKGSGTAPNLGSHLRLPHPRGVARLVAEPKARQADDFHAQLSSLG